MSELQLIYVQDRLAGASHALDLLSWMSGSHKDHSLGAFASTVYAEITEDRDVLVRLAQRLAAGPSATKETGAWLSEKIARLKLADQGATAIGTANLWNSWYSESVGSEHFGRRWIWSPRLTLG